MKDQIIDFETAKLAKEKGIPVLYTEEKPHYIIPYTQSLLQKYLRENNIVVYIIPVGHSDFSIKYYYYEIFGQDCQGGRPTNRFFTYEKALETGLFEALKLIKNG